MQDMGVDANYEERIVQEASIMGEKADITEEITRLKSHLIQFNHILKEEYPVGKLNDLIEKLDFTNENCLLEWLQYWRGCGQDEMILNYFEEFYKNNNKNFHGSYLDIIFDIALSYKGKDYAYKWVVRSIIENFSWITSYSSWENTKKRFLHVKNLYRDKWQDIIVDSSEYKYGNEFVIGESHLVYFLSLIGEKNLAYEFMKKLVYLLEEDMGDLPLEEVSYL